MAVLKIGARVVPSNSGPCNVCLFAPARGRAIFARTCCSTTEPSSGEYIRIPGRIVRQKHAVDPGTRFVSGRGDGPSRWPACFAEFMKPAFSRVETVVVIDGRADPV